MKGFAVTVPLPLEDAEAAVREALATECFGVLSVIDVATTLRAKLGIERAPLKILGACNPTFAHQALVIDHSVALVLPCNVVLEEGGPNETMVTIADPRELITDEALRALVADAASKLDTVATRLRDRHGID